MDTIVNKAQKYNHLLLTDAIGYYLDDIAKSVEKQQKLRELLFDDQDNINETLWIFELIVKELQDYRKVEKSSCMIKILIISLNNSKKFWIKIFNITNSKKNSFHKFFLDLLNIRAFRHAFFDIVTTYFKSLTYDGHYFISEDLVEEKSKVILLKSLDFSHMIGLFYFLLNYKNNISKLMSKYMSEMDADFTRYLHKSFRILSL